MDKLATVVVEGTTRPNRQSIKVARLLFDQVKQHRDLEAIFVDPIELKLPGDGNDPENKDPQYTKITKKADGFIIVVPEYNHSFPGSLKRLLDSELKNYIHKPALLAGVSSGQWGGVRAIESILSPLREMGMVVCFSDLIFPNVNKLFDEKGKLTDDSYISRINKSLDEFIWMAKTLRHGRKSIKKTSN